MNTLLLSMTAAAVLSSPAAAVVAVTLDRDNVGNGAEFTQADVLFNLPSNFTNALLNIREFSADDAAVVQINGTSVYGVGIFGPGNGTFRFTQNGPAEPFTFAGNGVQNVSTSGPFVAGDDIITFLLNNNAGINPGGGGLTGGPFSLQFRGDVTFDLASPIPEPATWAMMIVGFGLVGSAVRRRPAVARQASA